MVLFISREDYKVIRGWIDYKESIRYLVENNERIQDMYMGVVTGNYVVTEDETIAKERVKNRVTQVKIFKGLEAEVESDINSWLEMNSDIEEIDIKVSNIDEKMDIHSEESLRYTVVYRKHLQRGDAIE